MAYRNLMITNPAALSIKNNQLVIETDKKHQVPLEDIGTILLESPQIKLSSHTLAAFAGFDICLYVCDSKHLPCAVSLPYNGHFRQFEVLKAQLSLSKPAKKQLWRKIVEQKILNQAKVLSLLNKGNVERLKHLSSHILSGDSGNTEGTAAAIYFKSLFGDNFARSHETPINAGLNYGYAILRGCIARSVSTSGLVPAMGIHHCSELNRFNLVDDLIEPFRPLVDLFVAKNLCDKEDFETSSKVALYNLLNHAICIDGKKYAVTYAIEKCVSSFTSYCKGDAPSIHLPELIDLAMHEYE